MPNHARLSNAAPDLLSPAPLHPVKDLGGARRARSRTGGSGRGNPRATTADKLRLVRLSFLMTLRRARPDPVDRRQHPLPSYFLQLRAARQLPRQSAGLPPSDHRAYEPSSPFAAPLLAGAWRMSTSIPCRSTARAVRSSTFGPLRADGHADGSPARSSSSPGAHG